MTNKLSASARKVQEALAAAGLELEVVELPASTRTAREAAAAVGCGVEQIVKSLVFRSAGGQPVVVLASGPNRVDEGRVGTLLGEPIAKADAEFVRRHTGFAIGGVPPVGYPQPIRTFLDRTLLDHDEVWAAAGTPHAVFKMASADLPRLTGATAVAVC